MLKRVFLACSQTTRSLNLSGRQKLFSKTHINTNECAASIHYIHDLLCLYTTLLCFILCIHYVFFLISLQAYKRQNNDSLLLSPLGWLIYWVPVLHRLNQA